MKAESAYCSEYTDLREPYQYLTIYDIPVTPKTKYHLARTYSRSALTTARARTPGDESTERSRRDLCNGAVFVECSPLSVQKRVVENNLRGCVIMPDTP